MISDIDRQDRNEDGNLGTSHKIQSFASPKYDSRPDISPFELQIGISFLDSHSPPHRSWAHSFPRGVVLTKPQASPELKSLIVHFCCCLQSLRMLQKRMSSASSISAFHAMLMPSALVYTHLFPPVPSPAEDS